MLVQNDDLPQYDVTDGWMDGSDREVLEEEELLEREYLRDDGEEDEELEKQVVMIISFQHVFFFSFLLFIVQIFEAYLMHLFWH